MLKQIIITIIISLISISAYHFLVNSETKDIPVGYIKKDSTMVFAGFQDTDIKYEEYVTDTIATIRKDSLGEIVYDSITNKPIISLSLDIDTLKKVITLDSISYISSKDFANKIVTSLNTQFSELKNFDVLVAKEFNKMVDRVDAIDPNGKIK